MKKLTAAVAALALFFSASAFGTEPGNDLTALLNPSRAKIVNVEKVSKVITSAFSEEFADATNVNWRENNGLYFGYFTKDKQEFTVAYTADGEMFALARQVKIGDLPVEISNKLSGKYKDATVTDNAFEIVMEGETSYYLTIENKTSSRLVKFLPGGLDETLKRTKKKVLVGTVS